MNAAAIPSKKGCYIVEPANRMKRGKYFVDRILGSMGMRVTPLAQHGEFSDFVFPNLPSPDVPLVMDMKR
jgi:hypothetical protein